MTSNKLESAMGVPQMQSAFYRHVQRKLFIAAMYIVILTSETR